MLKELSREQAVHSQLLLSLRFVQQLNRSKLKIINKTIPQSTSLTAPFAQGSLFVGANFKRYRADLHKPKPPLCKGRWVLHSKTRRDCPTITHTPIRTFLFCRKWKKLFTNPTFCSKIYKSMRINAFAVFSETEGHIIQRKVLSQL